MKKLNIIAPEGSFVVSAAKGRGDIIAKFVFFFLFSSVFPDFSLLPKSSENGRCFCSCCWWVSGEVENSRKSDLFVKEGVVFICTFNPFMYGLILQNDRQFPGFAGSIVCAVKSVLGNRIIIVKSEGCWNEKIKYKIWYMHGMMATVEMTTLCFYVYLVELHEAKKPILVIIDTM